MFFFVCFGDIADTTSPVLERTSTGFDETLVTGDAPTNAMVALLNCTVPVFHLQRGQLATPAERNRVEDVIWELENRTPIQETATSEALVGRWALVYASEDPTRSSPFFWAFRCEPWEAVVYDEVGLL